MSSTRANSFNAKSIEHLPKYEESDGFVSDPELRDEKISTESDLWSIDSDWDTHLSNDKNAMERLAAETTDEPAGNPQSQTLVGPGSKAKLDAAPDGSRPNEPVRFHLGAGPGMDRTATALYHGSKGDVAFRWTYGKAFTRTRTLWDGLDNRLLDVERLSITRHGHWIAKYPSTEMTVVTIERIGILPLRLKIQIQRQDEKDWTNLTAKRTPFLGWAVTTECGMVYAGYREAWQPEFKVTVSPDCDARLAALFGFVFREIELVIRAYCQIAVITLARKGVAMSSRTR